MEQEERNLGNGLTGSLEMLNFQYHPQTLPVFLLTLQTDVRYPLGAESDS